MMERQFFSGNTIEQAVLAAARHYGLDPSRVAYRLRDKKHGFLNIRRRVVIEVDPEAPEAPEPPEGSVESAEPRQPVEARRPRQPVEARKPPTPPRAGRRPDESRDDGWRGSATSWTAEEGQDPEAAAATQALSELGSLLDLRLEPSVRRDGDILDIELPGEDSEALLEKDGAALDAIEHLLPRMVRGLVGTGIPCRVDSGGYRVAHESEMQQLAEEVAEEVRQERRPQVLEPMSPADRRLVHMALAEDPTVRTESEGGGFMKRVRISPT